MAVKGELDITKASYNAFGNLREDYCLYALGGAHWAEDARAIGLASKNVK